ncbi:glycosyltransferase 87 family protein [Kallotenue papyrolyticum]|uniref:glycosyltransferase 87 family protein n=1 Tax=Kallotenue papyrolyticum TaxID=1325125 RepID=UPI001376C022|nr:glycosyltransferase 87 family protein [Kallotenue papyrolyticum]
MSRWISSSHRAIGVWVGLALTLDLTGAQHVYRLASVGAAALVLLALLWLAPADSRGGLAPWLAPPWRALALLPLLALIAAMLDLAVFVPPNNGWNAARLALLLGGGLALLLGARAGAAWLAGVALGLGTIIRVTHMHYIPIAPPHGDMLPLVQGALTHLLAGASPYRTYQMPWPVPLTYLPLTWLAYLPAFVLQVDLRWTNIVAELAILSALLWVSAQRQGWSETLRREPALALWAWLYLQPSVIHWDTGNTAPITWALLALLWALALSGRTRATAVALGCAAATSPLVAVFAVLLGLYWLRQHGARGALRLAALAAAVAALLILPFLLWTPHAFVEGTYRWFNQIDGWPRQKWLETDPPVWSIITGFSGEFWSRGAERWLKPLQALIVLAIAALFWWRGARVSLLTAHAVAAYLGFMLFNPVLWPYLYNPALVVGLVGIAAAPLPEGARAAQAPTTPAAIPALQVKGP